MIDLHSHTVYGVDDGAQNIDTSRTMLQMAAKSGTEVLFCTPHIIEYNKRIPWELITRRVNELNELAKVYGLNLRVLPGAELMMNADLLKALKEDKAAYRMGGTSYVLVEMPMNDVPLYARDFWYEVQLLGLTPILAHPERYPALDTHTLLKWMRNGVLTQINGGSLLGLFGPEAKHRAHKLLSYGMVSFIGSDAHNTDKRRPDLSGAYKELRRLVGRERAEEIAVINPLRLMNNDGVSMELPDYIIKKKYRFGPGSFADDGRPGFRNWLRRKLGI